jgi:hypothetical protein
VNLKRRIESAAGIRRVIVSALVAAVELLTAAEMLKRMQEDLSREPGISKEGLKIRSLRQ